MNLRVEFHYDFGSPNAYLSHRVLPGIAERTGVEIHYVPVLLGGIFKSTNNRSPMEQFADVLNKPEYRGRTEQTGVSGERDATFSHEARHHRARS